MAFDIPRYLENKTYTAQLDRSTVENLTNGEGIISSGALKVVSFGDSLDVTVATGAAAIRSDFSSTDGVYLVNNASSDILTVTANGSNPKLVQIIARVYDTNSGSGSDVAQAEILDGIATSGATLDNRTGAASLPSSAILLADILVPAGATSISSTDMRDRRQVLGRGLISEIITTTATNQVSFLLDSDLPSSTSCTFLHSTHDTYQSAALMYLPNRIISATKIHWKYGTSAVTVIAGNYVIGIYDASGRKIIDTGAIALQTTANTVYVENKTITATTFEAGYYWILFGIDTSAGNTNNTFTGISGFVTAGSRPSIAAPNKYLYATSGGTTAPTTILSMTDVNGVTETTSVLPVPIITLATG